MTDMDKVKSWESLQVFLQEQAEQNERLFHYTTLESLMCIIRNKSFRITRMDLMNDKAEKKLGNQKDRSENYVMSFTQGKEYISMWAMYGRPSGIKLRLDFDRELFQKTINNNFYRDSQLTRRIPVHNLDHKAIFSKSGWVLSDIVYLDKDKHLFKHNGGIFTEIDANEAMIENMAGFVKYDAWEFEKETRLSVNIRSDYEVKPEYPSHIYTGISKDLIKTFHVTFNPWLSDEMKKVVREGLKSVAHFDVPCDDSSNDGEIDEF